MAGSPQPETRAPWETPGAENEAQAGGARPGLKEKPLSETARRVLEIDEGSFTEYVRELTRRALTAYKVLDRKKRLKKMAIALGTIRPEQIRRDYEISSTEIPYCQEQYGDSRGAISAYIDFIVFGFGYGCLAKTRHDDETNDDENDDDVDMTVDAAYINRNMEVMARPSMLYDLYKFFYKELGTGARPLLELAEKAEQEGDKEVADVLRRIYALLEASKGIIREIEQKDYSGVKVEIDESEVERKVEEAVSIIARAKWLAKYGSLANFIDLVTNSFALSPLHEPTIRQLIYSATGEGRLLRFTRRELEETIREADIYDTIIRIAEQLGLEVKFEELFELFEEEEEE